MCKTVLQECRVDENNNYKNESKIGNLGFQCGSEVCLDQDYWCSKETEKFNVEILEDDILQINCQNLHLSRQESSFCSNASHWIDRTCISYFKRCAGNWPGKCRRISVISCKNSSDLKAILKNKFCL